MTKRGNDQAPDAPSTETSAVAVIEEAPGRALVRAVDDRRPQLASLLGVELDSERGKAILDRFVTVALHAATSSPELLACTTESLVESIRQSAILGLEPTGALGDGAIIRYDNTVRRERPGRTPGSTIVVNEKVPTATFQPMYRGLLKLARRSAQIRVIDAHVVYRGDLFEIEMGTEPRIRHVPWPQSGEKDRGEPVSAYAFAKLATGETMIEPMTVADVESVRKKSRAGQGGPWVEFWSEMARKTVLRRLMKRLPLESAAEHALRLESETEGSAAIPDVASPESVASSAPRNRLLARLGRAPEADQAETVVDPPVDPRADAAEDANGAGDVEEGVVRAEETSETATEAAPKDAERLCGAPSPYKEGESCPLAPHKRGTPHGDEETGTWL